MKHSHLIGTVLVLTMLFSFLALAQQYPDYLVELQEQQEGKPDLVIESFTLEQLPAEVLFADGKTFFSTDPALKADLSVRNKGDSPAIGYFTIELALLDVEGSGILRPQTARTTLLDLIHYQLPDNQIQLVPLQIIDSKGDLKEDFARALNIFNLDITTINSVETFQEAREQGSILFYELLPGEALLYRVEMPGENILPEHVPGGLISPWPGLKDGTYTFKAEVKTAVQETEIANNLAETTVTYEVKKYREGPAVGVSNMPDLDENEIFVFSEEGKCFPAKLKETKMTVCLEDAGLFHADFIISGQKVEFGFFGKIFKFKETFTVNEQQLKATVYGNGVKIELA